MGNWVKKFEPQTPAMALGLTDHMWSLRELLLTPIFPPAGARKSHITTSFPDAPAFCNRTCNRPVSPRPAFCSLDFRLYNRSLIAHLKWHLLSLNDVQNRFACQLCSKPDSIKLSQRKAYEL